MKLPNFKKKSCGIAAIVIGIILIASKDFFLVFLGLLLLAAGIILLIYLRSAPKKQAVRYVRSYNSDVFHRPSCKAVRMMDRQNLQIYEPTVTYSQLTSSGLKPCSKCKPR